MSVAAELDAEEHLHGVAELVREVDDRGVEGDHAGVQCRERGERRAQHAGVDDARGHAAALVERGGSARRRATGGGGRGRPVAPGITVRCAAW